MAVDEETQQMNLPRRITPAKVIVFTILCMSLVGAAGWLPGVAFLQPDEQLLMSGAFNKWTRNGPGLAMYTPFVTRAIRRRGIKLDETQYIITKNQLTAEEASVPGPRLYFLQPYEEVVDDATRTKIVLEKDEYIRLLDAKSGFMRQVQGPATVVPGPQESATAAGLQQAMKLSELEHVIVTDKLSGAERLVKGPTLLFPETAYETVGRPGHATRLSELQYVIVSDRLTGSKRVVRGPVLFFPGSPHETVGTPRQAFELKRHQYVRLLDQATGTMRVERGEGIIFPKAHEVPMDDEDKRVVSDAVHVDDETAVLVRSLQTGQQRLVTEKGLFFPEPLEEIIEVRKLVRVEPHEVAIVRDNKGAFTFHAGNGSAGDESGTAFHIPPFSELVTMWWSSGTSKEDTDNHIVRNTKQVAYKVPVQKIDMRPQYAFFEYKVRTSDNVELLLEGTIFWSVRDVPRMIERTGDPKGDVWYHARSALIQAVSAVTLEQFMASFNQIVSRAAATDAAFYEERGVGLHSLEVTRYECADKKTAGVLQEIIQETTNRINRMQKQRSDNEVEHEELAAKIAIEKQRAQLIEAKTANDRLQASVEGEAEGTRLAQSTLAFLSQLNTSLPDNEERLALLRFFSEQATLVKQTEHLATGDASLFLTPQDMSLKIQAPSVAGLAGQSKTK